MKPYLLFSCLFLLSCREPVQHPLTVLQPLAVHIDSVKLRIAQLESQDYRSLEVLDAWHSSGMQIYVLPLDDSARYKWASYCFERSKQYKQLYYPDYFYQIARSMLMLGRCRNYLETDTGWDLIDSSAQIIQKSRDPIEQRKILSAVYVDSANYFYSTYSYYAAIEMNQKVLQRALDSQTLGVAYGNIARAFTELHQFDSALLYLRHLESFSGRSTETRSWIKHQKAVIYSGRYIKQPQHKNFLDTAKQLCQQSLKDDYELGHPTTIAKTLSDLSFLYGASGDYRTALDSIQRALQFCDKRQLSESYRMQGMIYDSLQQYKKALHYYELSVHQAQSLTQREEALKSEHAIAEIYAKTGAWTTALRHYHQADSLIQRIRLSLASDKAKLFWNQSALPLFEGALQVCLRGYSRNVNPTLFWENALHFSERAHAPLFWENLTLEPQVLRKMVRLSAKKDTTQNPSTRRALETTLNELEQRLPHQQSPSIRLKHLQKSLQPHFLGIEYFFNTTKDSIYILSWSKTQYRFYQARLDTAILNQFIEGVSNHGTSDLSHTHISYQLYQQLLEGVLKAHYHDSIQRIRVIPDGALYNLPFDGLIQSVRANDFLVYKYAFSYSFKVFETVSITPRTILMNSMAAFGITKFVNNRRYPNLKSTELDSILPDAWKIQRFQNATASKNNFKKQIPFLKFIHFSTHALAHHDFPEKSAIVLRGAKQDELLTVADVLQTKMERLEIAILAACQTGIGKLEGGEGSISLARAFRMQGSASVLMTLYRVEGYSTRNIMKYFYANISDNQTLDIALQQAKCAFLKDKMDEKAQHPYYWSAMALIGNIAPIAIKQNP